MKKTTTLLGAAALLFAFAAPAQAADIVVVKFRADDCASCAVMESQVESAVSMVGAPSVKAITVDISNAARWEAGAHAAFDANVVPVFNKYVGLTGFAAIVDANTRQTIGCVNENYSANQVADLIKRATGQATRTNASTRIDNFQCPPAHNKAP